MFTPRSVPTVSNINHCCHNQSVQILQRGFVRPFARMVILWSIRHIISSILHHSAFRQIFTRETGVTAQLIVPNLRRPVSRSPNTTNFIYPVLGNLGTPTWPCWSSFKRGFCLGIYQWNPSARLSRRKEYATETVLDSSNFRRLH